MKKLKLFIVLALTIFNASAQLKVGDQPTITEKSVALDIKGSNNKQGLWLPRVTDTSISGIRALNPPDGLVIYHTPSAKMFLRSNNSWVTFNSNSLTSVTAGGTTMTGPALTYNTGTAGTDFNISSAANTATWNLPGASVTNRGAVTTAAQTFGGAKTFADGITVNNGSTLNNGTTANNGLTVSGATTSTSNLTLGITSATTPGAGTDRYLTVDASGNVTLNALSTLNVTAGGTLITGSATTYSTGTTGSDFNIAVSGSTATWNLPNASPTSRGAVTIAAQNFGGLKTFDSGVVVNTSANITGATSATTKLKLDVTPSATTDTLTMKFLTVNNVGNVMYAKPVAGIFGPTRIRSFSGVPAEFPVTLGDKDDVIATFTLPAGTNLANPATVMMSPQVPMGSNIGVNWAVVTGPTTIKAAIVGNHNANQIFAAGFNFYITVFEY